MTVKASSKRNRSVFALLATLSCMTAQPQSLHFLGVLPGHSEWSEALGVSLDGRVVGTSMRRKGPGRAFVWTLESGLVDLGTLGGVGSDARAITPDGRLVFGSAHGPDGVPRSVSWTVGGAIQPIDHVLGIRSGASGVSADGRIVVGWVALPSGVLHAIRWTDDGRSEMLGSLRGDSIASDVSADGRVVVGGFDVFGRPLAFRWENGTMYEIDSGGQEAGATAVSADGTVIVG